MEIQEFGKLQDDTKASLLTIENKNGMRLSMTDFGAAIVSLQGRASGGCCAGV